jgi:prepilin-type N-terminal cleavage/methylation domain-containing protein
MARMIPIARLHAGYSLIELVMAIAILAIVSAMVTLSITAQTKNYVVTEADKLRRNLSHVQALALGWGARLRVTSSASGYAVTCRTALGRSPCNAVDDAVTDPATGATFSVALSSGVSLSQSGGTSSTTLDFDSLGRPVGATSLLDASTTYTLTGSSRTVSVAVLPITGFASATY